MLVVADSSALIAMAVCNGLPLSDHLFREVKIPPAVFEECTLAAKPAADVLDTYLREKVSGIDLNDFAITAVELGRGELEAMALCKRLGADRLLVDDRRARRAREQYRDHRQPGRAGGGQRQRTAAGHCASNRHDPIQESG